MVEWQQRTARVGAEQELHPLAGGIDGRVGDVDGHVGVSQRQCPEALGHGRGQPRRGRSTGRADGVLGGTDRDQRGGQSSVQLAGPLVEALQLVEPLRRLVAEDQDLGEVVAVLADEVAQQLAAGPHGSEALGVVLDAVAEVADLRRHVVQLGQQRGQPAGHGAVGRPATERGEPGGDGVATGAIRGERGVGGGSRLPVPERVGQRVLLGGQPGLLLGIVDAGGVQLGHLVAQEVGLAGPRALVAPERSQLGVQLGHTTARRPQRTQVDVPEAVERSPLSARREQGLVVVLAVQLDEAGGGGGERGRRRRPPVDVSAGATVGRDDAGQHDLVVAGHEATVDAGLGRAGSHDRGVGAATDEQLERLDQHRLAGPGLARDRGRA